jgi:hypothetical protein
MAYVVRNGLLVPKREIVRPQVFFAPRRRALPDVRRRIVPITATIALVTGQTVQANSTTASTFTYSLPNNPTTGNFVVACCAFGNSVGITITSIQDGAGTPNTYTQVTNSPFTGTAQQTAAIAFLANAPGTANKNITWNFSNGVTGDFWAAEFSGVVTASPQDATPVTANPASSTTYNTTPSITTVTDGCLIVCAAGSNGDIGTPGGSGGGSTGTGVNSPFTAFGTVGSTDGGGGEWLVQGAHGAQAINFSLSVAGTGSAIIAAFKAAATVARGGTLPMMGVG